jgi:hypothetical protein
MQTSQSLWWVTYYMCNYVLIVRIHRTGKHVVDSWSMFAKPIYVATDKVI